jgi:hypothetical protein
MKPGTELEIVPTRDPIAPSNRVEARRWLVLPVLCLSVFLVVVDRTIP